MVAQPARTVDVYGRQVRGHVVEGPWAAALSELVGRSLTLVEREDSGGRPRSVSDDEWRTAKVVLRKLLVLIGAIAALAVTGAAAAKTVTADEGVVAFHDWRSYGAAAF
jgi:hypothetical protein